MRTIKEGDREEDEGKEKKEEGYRSFSDQKLRA